MAKAMEGEAKPESNYRRLQRFFSQQELDQTDFTHLFPQLLDLESSWVLCLDRTNWKFGKTNINILMLAVAHQGVAIPLIWALLDKQGNSKQGERIALMQQFVKAFPQAHILALTADREFIGEDWIRFLKKKQIPFCLRIRENQQLTNAKGILRAAKVLFKNLKRGQGEYLPSRLIQGTEVHITAHKHEEGELVVLIHSLKSNTPEVCFDFVFFSLGNRVSFPSLQGLRVSTGTNSHDRSQTALQIVGVACPKSSLALPHWSLDPPTKAHSGQKTWTLSPESLRQRYRAVE